MLRYFAHLKHQAFKKIGLILLFIISLALSQLAFAEQKRPKLFLFMDRTKIESYQKILSLPCVAGAQVIYTWKELEPKKGDYDFAKIEKDIAYLNSIHKKLFIQLQDRSFKPKVFYVPDYIRKESIYHGGVASQYDFPVPSTGWVARVWDPAVRQRFQLLLQKLGAQFDGRIYGINLPETAADFSKKNPPQGFTPDNYFHAELDNLIALRKAFHKSIVMQYVNFFPGEWNNSRNYMGTLVSYAIKHEIGLGGPDDVPFRKGQMKNSYPFYHQNKGKLKELGIAVQEPDYLYKNPETNDHYHFADFYSFATNYLGATILFWNVQEPFFSQELLPVLNKQNFDCAL